MIPGSLKIFNFGTRAFDLTFTADSGAASKAPYAVASMDRLNALMHSLGVTLSKEDIQALRSGSHLIKPVELLEQDVRTFFQ